MLSTACQSNPSSRNLNNNMRSEAPDGGQRNDQAPRHDGGCGGNAPSGHNNNPGYANGPHNNAPYNNNNNNAPANAQEDDWTINERVRDALYNDPNMPPSTRAITVETRDRVVTLTGPVSSKDEANFIIKKVKGIPGVRNVNSQLSFGQGPSGQQQQGKSY